MLSINLDSHFFAAKPVKLKSIETGPNKVCIFSNEPAVRVAIIRIMSTCSISIRKLTLRIVVYVLCKLEHTEDKI